MNIITITHAKTHLAEVVRDSDVEDVVLVKHGRPAAIVMSAARHEALLTRLEELSDRLAVHERDGVTMDFDMLVAELGLDD